MSNVHYLPATVHTQMVFFMSLLFPARTIVRNNCVGVFVCIYSLFCEGSADRLESQTYVLYRWAKTLAQYSLHTIGCSRRMLIHNNSVLCENQPAPTAAPLFRNCVVHLNISECFDCFVKLLFILSSYMSLLFIPLIASPAASKFKTEEEKHVLKPKPNRSSSPCSNISSSLA